MIFTSQSSFFDIIVFNLSFMDRVGSCISRIIRKFDLFATPQYLRYKGEGEFKTATGGFSSLAIITILIVVSSSQGLQTIKKQVINASAVYNNQVDPSNFTLNFSEGQFMVAVSLLNATNNVPFVNYFSVALYPKQHTPEVGLKISDPVYLVPCTPNHFANNQITKDMYTRMHLNTSLCPPLGFSITIGGRQASEVYTYFSLEVMRCNSQVNPNCVSDSQFTSAFSNKDQLVKLRVPFINTIINAGLQDYKQVYIEDQNYYFFTMGNAVNVIAQIQRFQINTDQTLMPYQDLITEYVPAIPYPFTSSMIPVASRVSNPNKDIYALVIFTKTAQATIFYRSFTKLDTYFSYVGGLIGTIVGAFILMRHYSECAYLISIAEKVFNYDDHNEIHSKGFNFLQYAKMGLKQMLNLLHYRGNWHMTDMFLKSVEEMSHQLSIELLLEKISYLEEAVNTILDQHQLQALMLKEKRPILSAEYVRKKNITSKNLLNELLGKMKIGSSAEKEPPVSSNAQLRDPFENIETGEQIFKTNMQSQQKEKRDSRGEASPQDKGKMQAMEMLKTSLFRVISEGESGHPASKKIISRTSRKILQELGIKKGEHEEQLREKMETSFVVPDSSQEIEVLQDESETVKSQKR